VRLFLAILFTATVLLCQVKVDNVLLSMVPPGSDSLVGAQMAAVKASPLYQKMLAARKLPELDRFANESGFDPRTDVRELLFASTKQGGVLLARGKFDVKAGLNNPDLKKNMKLVRHGEYVIYAMSTGDSGFCILDSTLAAAGTVPVLEAALDEWKSGKHGNAKALLARLKTLDSKTQLWGISTGFASFVADHMPKVAGGNVDFSQIFRGVEDTWFQLDMSQGMRAEIHGTTAKEADAVSLRDAAKGLVGFGRLSVPEGQPELLRVWDGITVEQTGNNFMVKADIKQELMDKLVAMMETTMKSNRPRPKTTEGKPRIN